MIVEAKAMRRSARLAEKQETNLENDVQFEPKVKKSRSDDKISKVDLDNDTMVESFKYLNYSQLAINSVVSKRFRALIKGNRHSLARLYVPYIGVDFNNSHPHWTKVFGKVLSPEAYNDWVIRNGYSKQSTHEDLFASMETTGYNFRASTKSSRNISDYCHFQVNAYYGDPAARCWNRVGDNAHLCVFFARAELSHKYWPFFQHFVRLTTDPSIYIANLFLDYQNDVFNLLAGALNPNHSRVQCKTMCINLRGNIQKSLIWAKNYVRCSEFYIDRQAGPNRDEAFADFLLTGANCTSSISVDYQFDVSQAMVNFIKKFMDLKNYDGCHIVETINSRTEFYEAAEVMKRNFSDFVVKEEKEIYWTTRTFEFVNDNIGKKLQHTTKFYSKGHGYFRFSLC